MPSFPHFEAGYSEGRAYSTPWRGATGSGTKRDIRFSADGTWTFDFREDWSEESSSGECWGGTNTMTSSGTYERSGDNGEILAMTVLKHNSNGSDLPGDATKNFECRLLPPTKVTLRHFLNGEEPREGETAQNYYDEKFVMRDFVLPLLEVKDAAIADANATYTGSAGVDPLA